MSAGKIVSDDAEIVERRMGELRAAGAFADRPDIGGARLEPIVDGDVAARVELDAGDVQSDPGSVGRATRRDQDVAPVDRSFTVGHAHVDSDAFTRSPASTRMPPSFNRTSSVFGATKRPVPMISSAPLALYRSRCMAIRPSTMSRLRCRTRAMSIAAEPAWVPNSAACFTSAATFALQISFLLGRQLIFGHEPPINRRSTTAVRSPDRAVCQARNLPPSPLPRMRTSTRSGGWALMP